MSIFKKRLRKDQLDAFVFYYKNFEFACIDLSYGFIGLFLNPYRICRKFFARRGQKISGVYGETPYTTYEKMAQECGVGPHDIWVELGSGRGKGCFWLHHFTGCKVIGIDCIPVFISLAKIVKFLFRVRGVQFFCLDIEKCDFANATIVYLYGLWPAIKIPKGIKVITTGEPLEGYQILKKFWIRFPWGRTTAYLQSHT